MVFSILNNFYSATKPLLNLLNIWLPMIDVKKKNTEDKSKDLKSCDECTCNKIFKNSIPKVRFEALIG